MAVHIVMVWSGLYEIIEGMVAHVVSPELGATFNGIQGDVWDAQKDVSLAMTGALCSMAMTLLADAKFCATRVVAETEFGGKFRQG